MSTKKALILLITLSLAVFQISCSNSEADGQKGTNGSHKAQANSSKVDSEKEKKSEETLIPVETTTVSRGTISSYLLYSSNLETEKMIDVYSRVQGLVEKINLEEGTFVAKGQVLLELEADEYILAEEKAHVEYQQKQSMYNRSRAMADKNLLSNEEYETAKFAADAARIAWQQAKLNLKYTKITSTITGVIGERLCREGDRIQTSDKLFTVVNTDEMIAVVHIPEKEIGIIKKGQQAYIYSDHIKGDLFPGWIKRVSPVVDPQSGTFKVTIGVRNTNNKLRPGMFVNCRIITNTHKNAILIPKTAIIYENEYMNVFVVRDSIAHKIKLDVGYQDHEKIESLSSIEEGDKIILVGQAGLKDQTKVKIVTNRETKFSGT